MTHVGKLLSVASGMLGGWLARYAGWLMITSFVTLGGAIVVMLLKDWSIETLFTSMMAWPALAIAMLPFGRVYLISAVGGGLLFNLILLIA